MWRFIITVLVWKEFAESANPSGVPTKAFSSPSKCPTIAPKTYPTKVPSSRKPTLNPTITSNSEKPSAIYSLQFSQQTNGMAKMKCHAN